jgi:hypothetical protein
MPPPYGHVVFWRIHGATMREVRDRLLDVRSGPPLTPRRVRQICESGLVMLREAFSGVDLRRAHRQKYHKNKNPWIASALPPLLHRTSESPPREPLRPPEGAGEPRDLDQQR